jgi:hypothetical protein
MINLDPAAKTILEENRTISTSAGALIEYNMNRMVDYIDATSTADYGDLTNSYKKLFPIDTIYKPNRPMLPGIKYLIYTVNNTDTPNDTFISPREVNPIGTRLYYPGNSMTYKYWLGPKDEDISIDISYFLDEAKQNPKLITANKIVARFEDSHDVPSSWTITATKSDDSTITVTGTELINGEATVYYNGTGWSTTAPSSFSSYQQFKSISLQATNSSSGKLLGVIEFAPFFIIDVTNDVQTFTVTKETSNDSDSIIPVGTLTANTLALTLNKFTQGSLKLKEYIRGEEIDPTNVYLFKDALIKPYITVKDNNNEYKVNQGYFYMHSWNVGEFGDANITALDAAKILQETLAPEILIEDYPITAVIRVLLDSVGFSNYQFFTAETETSVPSVTYWWSDRSKTVWECLQELCRDIQMNAFVDENNMLNFYSRDYIYDSERSSDWLLTSEADGAVIPNIINFTASESASANAVKVIWSAASTSQYDGSSSPLWKSEETFLGAGTLAEPLSSTDEYFFLNNSTISQDTNMQSLFSFNGYTLINDEIIEYDGIEYQYVPKDDPSSDPIPVLIKSDSDIYKYRYLSKPGYSNINDVNTAYFKPTGRYKIKERALWNTTTPSVHEKSPSSYINASGENDTRKFNRYKINLLSASSSTKKDSNSGSFRPDTNPNQNTISKSFLVLDNLDKDKTTYDIAVKTFDSVNVSDSYFAFGTRLYFDTQFESPAQIGGVAFFTGDTGKQGYYITIHTTASAKTNKEVRIMKFNSDGKVVLLSDSQSKQINRLAGIYAGQAYNIDVRVKAGVDQNEIVVFINGFKIKAVDNTNEVVPKISKSKNFGLLCGQGVAYYEYAYAKSIDKEDYDQSVSKSSFFFDGVFSDDTISLLHGNLIYSQGANENKRDESFIEFGSTAREIRKAKVKYNGGPGIPLKFSTASNRYATVLDTRLQPFEAETYVLNNTTTFVPLDDGNYTSFYVLGNTINKSSPLEYSTDEPSELATKEPVIFESNWIQSEPDAKSLGDWIKSTVLNKGKYVEMEIFGNPALSAGDIVSINYPLQGLDGDNKYIIVRAETQYLEGVTTRLTCRQISSPVV